MSFAAKGTYRPVLEKKIADLNMKKTRKPVILAGNIPEAARYLKAFDIFPFPFPLRSVGLCRAREQA
jgi:hypothetical protein